MKSDLTERTVLIQKLQAFVAEAKQYRHGHSRRQRALTKAIRILPTLLRKERSPHYNDALQQTFEYFCRHIDDYDPALGNVVTWLNSYLSWRLVDGYKAGTEIPFSQFMRNNDDLPFADIPDPIDYSAFSILNSVQTWVESDPTGELKSTYMKKYPYVTAQFLILQRLPPQTSWKTLSKTLGINISALSAFYQRHCITRLRAFGKAQGYL